jgi:uncharacterized membrane protein HdeD (DUF308 family)
MLRILINNWWLLALRGVFALLFAALAFSSHTVMGTWLLSAIALAGVVVFFGLLAIAAGVCTIVAGVRGAGEEKWWLLFWDGVAVCIFGAVVLLAPELDLIWLARMLAVCAVGIGIVELLMARTLRRHVPDEWFLAVSGAASFCFGLYLLLLWTQEVTTMLRWLATYAAFSGLAILGLASRLRTLRHSVHELAGHAGARQD